MYPWMVYLAIVCFTLFDLCIDMLSPVLEIFVLYYRHTFGQLSFYEIQKLLACLLFVAMCPHMVVGIIIDTKHI